MTPGGQGGAASSQQGALGLLPASGQKALGTQPWGCFSSGKGQEAEAPRLLGLQKQPCVFM